ncbi:MAG: thiamine diphosphokinase [Tissierellia bacterium]|nr:thiamine diphosphokinase [Tissierellia bacterium]
MRTLILSGGQPPSQSLLLKLLAWQDLLICADRGYEMVLGLDYPPDLVIGDFDSIHKKALKTLKAQDLDLEVLPAVKDDTDTEIALKRALERGASDIFLVAGTGTRIDHILASLFLGENFLDQAIRFRVIDDHNLIEILGPGDYPLEKTDFDYVSVLPISPYVEMTSQGMAYNVQRAKLRRGTSLGVSNEIRDPEGAKITLHSGRAFLIYSKD